MLDDFLDLRVEFIAVDHHDVATAKAQYLDVGPDANDLELFGMGEAGMGLLHLDDVVKLIIDHHGLSSILTAAGILGRPGMVKIDPQRGMTKLAPEAKSISRT